MIVYDPTALDVVTPPISDVDFKVSFDSFSTIVSEGSNTASTEEDVNILVSVGSTVNNNYQVAGEFGSIYISGDESIATVDEEGRASRVSDGITTIIALHKGLSKGFNLSFTQSVGEGATIFSSWVAGSLAEEITSNVDGRIAGKTPSPSTLQIFSTVNHETATYVRSSAVWCADYQQALTGCNAWRDGSWGPTARAQTAITPRHIVGAWHYSAPEVGEQLRFVELDGTVHTRTITHTRRVGNTDIKLSLLDSDLPATISPLKTLPANWRDYIRNEKYGLPCLLRNQYGEARIFDLRALTPQLEYFTNSTMPTSRSAWYRELVVGDSGGPAMAMVNGELILITTWSSNATGPSYKNIDWSTEITALDALASINTGYTPTVADFTPFSNYAS